jgi:nucleoside-diphosphate-sugar epimerase
MKLLILGGTRFVGRHLVTAALARNHEVTLFNRGQHRGTHSSDLTNVETIYGDRNSDLSKLKGRRWDAVVDTSGYLPRTVRASAEVLSQSVDRYVFISSQSVYADVSVVGVDENAALATLTSEQFDQANAIDSSGQTSAVTYGKMYGGLKALCEQAAREVLPNRVLIIRPGLIVGPYDYTDRFTYWVVRVARGGEVLAPGRPKRYVQFIDVRDLAEWTVRMIEREGSGVYNANGLPGRLTMERLLEECKQVSESDASFTWIDDNFLMQEKVAQWSEMPLWFPEEAAPHSKGFMFINCNKAVGAGLSSRPLNDTIRDILTWRETNRLSEELKAGIDSDKERRLLRKWHETH